MRIGLVSDIHDAVKNLSQALAVLRGERVDTIVSLGDATDLFGAWNAADEVVDLLRQAGVVGVWGNHDYGLCREVRDEYRERFHPATLEYMATVRPRLELGGCHFSHVEPWLNPEEPAELWTFDAVPDEPERLRRSFAAISHRAAFIGHFHRWLAATEGGKLDWDGSTPLTLEAGRRYLVVIGPLFRGAFAILDTDRWVFEPRQLPMPNPTTDRASDRQASS
jgi:predicted phosphodiesterase